MNRRIIATLAAVLLAIVGGATLFSYVNKADARAVAELEPAQILVISSPVGEGTTVDAMAESVTLKSIPGTAVAPGALTSLDEVAGMVTVGDFVPGEQVVSHRFASVEVAAARNEVEVPPGFHQVTVQLDPVRVLGGHLSEGDSVGVFISLAGVGDQADADGTEANPAVDGSGNQTHLVLHHALVTRVQGAVTPAPADTAAENAAMADQQPAADVVPTTQVMVTFALDAVSAEKLVYAAEFERIWLSIEDDEANSEGTQPVTRENIYQ